MTGPFEPPPNDDDSSRWEPPPNLPPQPGAEWQPQAGAPMAAPPGPPGPPSPPTRRDRAQRFNDRPHPIAGGTLAGVGMALAILGVIIWAGGYAVSGATNFDGGGGSDSRNWLGIVLALAVTVLGYVVAATVRQGPLATAGVVASALGVPTALAFITLDLNGGTPINIDAVFVVSIIAWLISYGIVPGARGHGFYLGLSAIALWIYLVLKISPRIFGLPFDLIARSAFGSNIIGDDPTNDLSSLAAMSFVLAAAYYGIAYLLDRDGRKGAATPLVVAGFPVLVGAFLFASNDFGQVGTGITLVLVGFVLVLFGARAGRRFTSWAWGLGIVYGVGLLITKAAPDNRTAAGILFIVCGLGLAFIGSALAAALGEREYPES